MVHKSIIKGQPSLKMEFNKIWRYLIKIVKIRIIIERGTRNMRKSRRDEKPTKMSHQKNKQD